jgi:hypothetical protein
MDRPLRIIGIIVFGAMLGIPPMVCFTGASPRAMEVAHFFSLLFPATFWALSRIFIAEGREQERTERERADQEKRN